MGARSNAARSEDRRQFLCASASVSGLVLAGCASNAKRDEHSEGAEVTPGEDLMQEHGLLERILLVYGESARRLERGEQLDLAVVHSAAAIVTRFVEDYHEQLEETFVFPRLEQVRLEVELVATLRRQHARGREVTNEISHLSSSSPSPELARALRAFERMYRPHAAREDTVLFPAFRSVVGRSEYRELGEQFEDREHELLGEHGFEGAVAEVANIEAALQIDDLAQFTP